MRLTASFFARRCVEVAPQLLGCRLVHETPQGRRVGCIVEVEAYLGDGTDPASHSHEGPTERNRSMFGPPGRFYVYRSMGLHCCVNVVTEPAGNGAAVLLRALEPIEGLEAIRAARPGRPDRELANGPGKLARAFAIGLEYDGVSALRGALRLLAPRAPLRDAVRAGPRIGISRGTELRYRFFLEDCPWVTPSVHNRSARRLLR